jgi:hypothetical protein
LVLEEVVPSLNAEHDHGVLILVDLVDHPVGLESGPSRARRNTITRRGRDMRR